MALVGRSVSFFATHRFISASMREIDRDGSSGGITARMVTRIVSLGSDHIQRSGGLTTKRVYVTFQRGPSLGIKVFVAMALLLRIASSRRGESINLSRKKTYRSLPRSSLHIRLSLVCIEPGKTKVSEFDMYVLVVQVSNKNCNVNQHHDQRLRFLRLTVAGLDISM